MGARYKLSYYSPAGAEVIESVIFSSLSYFRKENEVGQLSVVIPPIYPITTFERDGRLELQRALAGQPFYLEGDTSFLIERARYSTSEQGEQLIELTASDMMVVLARRIVAYPAGNTYTDKVDFADDLMKEVFSENFGTAAVDANRDLSAYITDAADTSAGAAIAAEISWKNILDVFKDFAAASEETGVRLIFDIVKLGSNLYQLQTWANYRGVDHSPGSPAPIEFSQDQGNLNAPELILDWTDEGNYIYVTGRGENNYQPVEERFNAASIAQSPFSRIEVLANEGNSADPTVLQVAGDKILQERRPRILFNGEALDTPGLVYGLHYGYGDQLIAKYQGLTFLCRVNAVKIDIDSSGDKLDIRLEGETYA